MTDNRVVQRLSALLSRNRDQGEPPARDLASRMKSVGVPAKAIETLQLPGVATTAAMEAVMAVEKLDVLAAALLGPPGVGKTVAAAHAVAHVLRAEPPSASEPAMWVQASELTSRSHFSTDDDRRLRAMRRVRLLVVDDLGDEGSAMGVSALVDVLKGRLDHGKRLVLTSTLQRAAFVGRYGVGLADRLRADARMPDLFGQGSMR